MFDMNPAAASDENRKNPRTAASFLFNQHTTQEWQQQITQATSLVTGHINGAEKPFSGILPSELVDEFTRVDLHQPLESAEAALAELETLYLRDAVYFHHPKYLAHLNCPLVLPALLGESILSSINSSVDTWDQSAGGTLIEQKVIDWTLDQIGLGPEADGIFTSGGTQSNLMAMLLARDSHCKRTHPGHSIKYQGLPADATRWRIFSSGVSHFSIQKSAALLGLGYNAVVPVASDDRFRMDPRALDQAIEQCLAEGNIPLAVVATAGTTDFGSIDPLNAIAAVCRRHQVWMHVDAAYGCGLLVSQRFADRIDGICHADSVTVDYHKSFFQPVSCGAFFVRDHQHLEHVTCHADYLNPLSAKLEGTPNLVNKSIQTTKRFDALKMWLTLRIMGEQKLGEAFDTLLDRTAETHLKLAAHPHIDVLHQPQLSTQVFRFVPRQSLAAEVIDEINANIRKAIFRSGNAVVAGTKVDNRQYLKFTLLNPATTLADVEEVIDLIVHYGKELTAQHLSLMATE